MKKTVKIFFIMAILLLPMHSVYAKEFLSSFMHIHFGYIFSLKPYSSIVNEEEGSFSIPITSGDRTWNRGPSHYHYGLSFGLDFVPFSPIRVGDYGSAMKIGIRGVGRYHIINQILEVDTENNSRRDYGGQLANYYNLMIGPVIRYAPFARVNRLDGVLSASGGFTFYAIAGSIFNGDLTAFPAKRNVEGDVENYSTSISGWRANIGVGGEFTMCNVSLGLNAFYSYSKFKMQDKVYPDIGRTSNMNEMCFEIYMGIPVDFISRI